MKRSYPPRAKRLALLLAIAVALAITAVVLRRRAQPLEERVERVPLQELAQLSQKQPDSELVWSTLGRRFLDLGRPGEAQTAFREALARQPSSLRAAAGYACAMGLLGDWERADRMLTELESSHPGSPFTHYYRGALLMDAGDPEAAAEHFSKALAIYDNDAPTWYRLATCYVKLGQKANALKPALRATELNPDRVEFHVLAADLIIMSGKVEEGRKRLQQALKKWPKEPLPRYSLASDYLRQDKPTEAHLAEAGRLLREAVALSPEWPEARVEFAKLLLKQNDPAGALQQLEQIPQPRRKTGDSGYLLGQVFAKLGRTKEADAVSQEYQRQTRRQLDCNQIEYRSEQDPDNVELRLKMANCLVEMGNHIGAVREYTEVLRRDPKNVAAARALKELRAPAAL